NHARSLSELPGPVNPLSGKSAQSAQGGAERTNRPGGQPIRLERRRPGRSTRGGIAFARGRTRCLRGVGTYARTGVRAVSDHPKQTERYRLSALLVRHALPRSAAIGAIVLAV